MTVKHPADAENRQASRPNSRRQTDQTQHPVLRSRMETGRKGGRETRDHGIRARSQCRAETLSTAHHRSNPAGLRPSSSKIIKLTHRSTYILSTLKRDEMIREGRAREMDEVVRDARNAQANLLSSESSRRNEAKEQRAR